MPFGKYADKAVQSMSHLFNSPMANSIYRKAGSIGRADATWGEIPLITQSGKRRVGFGAGAVGALGASRSRGSGRSSGANGLLPKSSAPPPVDPYSSGGGSGGMY